jgi:CubicO group peptidase (beta-lactamase class C family)
LTDYPNKDVASKVTIHQLLTHTGGTGDFFGPEFNAHRLELRTLQDYIKLFGQRGPEFEPGSQWAYSNYGFLLLGVVIERVSGQSYYDYVRDHVYSPAGMTSTDSLPEDQDVPQRSIGYTKMDGGETWRPNSDTLPYRGLPPGAAIPPSETSCGSPRHWKVASCSTLSTRICSSPAKSIPDMATSTRMASPIEAEVECADSVMVAVRRA